MTRQTTTLPNPSDWPKNKKQKKKGTMKNKQEKKWLTKQTGTNEEGNHEKYSKKKVINQTNRNWQKMEPKKNKDN